MDGLSVWVGADTRDQTPPPRRGLSSLAPQAVPQTAEGPPIEITEENAAADADWLRKEIERFNAYVAKQFEQIQKGREEAARAATQAGARFVRREQELNRAARESRRTRGRTRPDTRRELAARRAELERRQAAVARVEDDLRRRAEEADEVEDALRAELEEREREVEVGRRAVEEEAQRLRARAPAAPAAPAAPDASPPAPLSSGYLA